jgi:hypothetical protein
MYGCFGAEIYGNNIIIATNPSGTITLMADRSGKSMVFYNSGSTTGYYNGHSYNYSSNPAESCPPDYVSEQVIHDTYIWSNRKTLTGAWDGWSTTNLLTCNGLDNIPLENRDFFTDIGASPGVSCGTLVNLPATCTTGVGYWATNQSCTDLTGLVGANPTTPISGTLYKCTATNTWTAYYTPLAYPHPLRGEGRPMPPQHLRLSP